MHPKHIWGIHMVGNGHMAYSGCIIGMFKYNTKIDEELSDNYRYLRQPRIWDLIGQFFGFRMYLMFKIELIM